MKFYAYQQEIIDRAPHKQLIALGTGCGKTRTTIKLAETQGGTVLIVAPKTQVLDKTWEREMEKISCELQATVISKEKFKKSAPHADILILDESHVFTGITAATRYRKKVEIPKASQLYESVISYVNEHKPKAIYLCSATPLPQPMALFGIARIFGIEWDYFAFRRAFYAYIPNIGRGVWVPKKDEATEARLVGIAKKLGTFGRLSDFFDVPDQVHKEITVGLSPDQKKLLHDLPLIYPEPLVRVGKMHTIEQGLFDGAVFQEYKSDEVIQLAKEFDKLLVFCRYTNQIDMLEKKLRKNTKHKILVLDGRTKDRRKLMVDAEAKGKKVIVIAQSQVSTGYELPSFRCTVFMSMSYSFIDYEQALGRTQRANNISKNVYVYLLSDEVDAAVLECVKDKKDFNELLFTK